MQERMLMNVVRRHCLTVARVVLSAWVGAAALFVVNGVRMVTSHSFDSVARDHIALIRFPPYYLLGFVLVGMGLLCILGAGEFPHRRAVLGLLSAALLLMAADYFWVYLPLERALDPPGNPRTPAFQTYHRASMVLNLVHVGLVLVAAVLVSRPLPIPPDRIPA
jgi:hypothetical protein